MCIQCCSKSLLKIGFMSPRLLPSQGEMAEAPAREDRPVLLFLDGTVLKLVLRRESYVTVEFPVCKLAWLLFVPTE